MKLPNAAVTSNNIGKSIVLSKRALPKGDGYPFLIGPFLQSPDGIWKVPGKATGEGFALIIFL